MKREATTSYAAMQKTNRTIDFRSLLSDFQDYSTAGFLCQFAQFQKNILCMLYSLGIFTLNITKKKNTNKKFCLREFSPGKHGYAFIFVWPFKHNPKLPFPGNEYFRTGENGKRNGAKRDCGLDIFQKEDIIKIET